jgi:nicotinamidase-related amidase
MEVGNELGWLVVGTLARSDTSAMNDALLLVDLINRFRHSDGERLLRSFRERLPAIQAVVDRARGSGLPLIYVNDNEGRWDSDAPALVRSAIEDGCAGALIELIAPAEGDRFVLKPRYSGFDHTPLAILLSELNIERLLLAGAATEGCVVQTAIDARELGYKVTILKAACATNDQRLERVSLEYAEHVAGVRIASGLEQVDPADSDVAEPSARG